MKRLADASLVTARRMLARQDDYLHDPRVPFGDNAAEREVRMSKLRWRASDARLDGWDLEGFQADRDGGEMRAWLVTPVALAVICVSVLFDVGVAVAGNGYGQNTYANARRRAAS
jgi:hypothetical protein